MSFLSPLYPSCSSITPPLHSPPSSVLCIQPCSSLSLLHLFCSSHQFSPSFLKIALSLLQFSLYSLVQLSALSIHPAPTSVLSICTDSFLLLLLSFMLTTILHSFSLSTFHFHTAPPHYSSSTTTLYPLTSLLPSYISPPPPVLSIHHASF